MKKTLFLAIVAVLIIPTVYAFSVSSFDTYDYVYKPGEKETFTFSINNPSISELMVGTELESDIEQYVTTTPSVDFKIPGMTTVVTTATIDYPEELPPGKYPLQITHIEIPEVDAGMAANPGVTTIFQIISPYTTAFPHAKSIKVSPCLDAPLINIFFTYKLWKFFNASVFIFPAGVL